MTLRVAIQMDPLAAIDMNGDSTFVMALEAQKRGHEIYHYLPHDLSFSNGKLSAMAHKIIRLERKQGDHFAFADPQILDLKTDVDVVLLRQDPPFDMAYITNTHLLETIHPETLVINNPREVRNAPEKLFVLGFSDLMPPTLISSHKTEIEAFRALHKDIIVKPLFGNGGAGVFRLKEGDENLNSLLEMFGQISREPLMVQAYVPAVRKGDKRIILIDGEPAGAVNRIPAEGEARSNLHVGGQAAKTELTTREIEICERIGPELKKRGLIFVGIDVIGDYLTEINVTSPTGLQEINRFNDACLEGLIWDAIERHAT